VHAPHRRLVKKRKKKNHKTKTQKIHGHHFFFVSEGTNIMHIRKEKLKLEKNILS